MSDSAGSTWSGARITAVQRHRGLVPKTLFLDAVSLPNQSNEQLHGVIRVAIRSSKGLEPASWLSGSQFDQTGVMEIEIETLRALGLGQWSGKNGRPSSTMAWREDIPLAGTGAAIMCAQQKSSVRVRVWACVVWSEVRLWMWKVCYCVKQNVARTRRRTVAGIGNAMCAKRARSRSCDALGRCGVDGCLVPTCPLACAAPHRRSR